MWKFLSSRMLNKKRFFSSFTIELELFSQTIASLILLIHSAKCTNPSFTIRLMIWVTHRWCKRESWWGILVRKALIMALLFVALSRVHFCVSRPNIRRQCIVIENWERFNQFCGNCWGGEGCWTSACCSSSYCDCDDVRMRLELRRDSREPWREVRWDDSLDVLKIKIKIKSENNSNWVCNELENELFC